MPRGKQNKRRSGRVKGRGAYYTGGRVLRGNGGFFDDLGQIAKSTIGPLIGAVGSAANSIIPGAGTIAAGIRNLTGLGAYTPVRSNAILAQPVPKVGYEQDKGIRYRHEEYLGDVTTSTDWEITQFHVNPGLPETFPWLSTIANSFQKYKINGLIFYLRSTSSVAIASSDNLALGTVLGAFQYNVYDTVPQGKIDMMSLSGSLSGKPSDDHMYPLECDPKKNVLENFLIRHTGVADDLAKYDHAVFNLATVNAPGEYSLGELWVSYDITLMAPKVEQSNTYFWNLGSQGISAATSGNSLLWPGEKAGLDIPTIHNTLGWGVVVATDNLPAASVPAGTAGYFNMVLETDASNSVFAAHPAVTVTDISGTGTVSVVSGPINVANGTGQQCIYAATLYLMTSPDKPMQLRVTVPCTGAPGSATQVWMITRASDTLVPPASSGRGVVPARLKVRRHTAQVARPAVESVAGDYVVTEEPEYKGLSVPSNLNRQTTLVNQAASRRG
jgi:hypothetical protein